MTMHYTADDTQSAKYLNSFLLRWNYGNCFCSSAVFGLKILSLLFVNTFYCCVYLPCCLVILNYLLASKQLMYELMLTFAVASDKIIFEGKTNPSVNLWRENKYFSESWCSCIGKDFFLNTFAKLFVKSRLCTF